MKTPGQRWEEGIDHDPRSESLFEFIRKMDEDHCGDSFCFKSGGDGDNGETLMFILDCWFEKRGRRAWETADYIAALELCEVEGTIPNVLPQGVTEEMIEQCKARRKK